MDDNFAVLDLKCNSVSAVLARWGKNGEYILEGSSRCDSRGLHKGVITDMTLATDSIVEVLQALKQKTGKRFRDVYTSISSPSVEVIASSGTILLSRYGREIARQDVEKCINYAAVIKLSLDREILHKLVRNFTIDGERGIKNPQGLEGVKLSAEVSIVTIDSSSLKNIAKCVALAGYTLRGSILSGLAISFKVLSPEQIKKGIALVNMCKHMTEMMTFHDGALMGCRILQLGVNDILGWAGEQSEGPLGTLLSTFNSMPAWDMINDVMVTGDVGLDEGVLERIEKATGRTVKYGTYVPKPFENLHEESIGCIGNLGMLDFMKDTKEARESGAGPMRKIFNDMVNFIDKYF
ncbi:MAG TPA: cell division protein FtsA [Candidatus Omnitrophota bacterium]|nr:cell division protein FtsA [Candidatus Omnitrophota bacterium]HPS20016.1 cell division protein FtsA [Candidatus Omnitrophota bacterium]